MCPENNKIDRMNRAAAPSRKPAGRPFRRTMLLGPLDIRRLPFFDTFRDKEMAYAAH